MSCRQLEARAESLAQQALGTRATLVRAFRAPLHASLSLDSAQAVPTSVIVLVAAQVRAAFLFPSFFWDDLHNRHDFLA